MSSPTFDVLTQPQIIRAGAGAGKTTTLIATFIEFSQQFQIKHGRLPKIIITTFTRKATQEIKERLLVKALSTKDEKLFHHINKKHSVHISTIHGLLTIFLNQNSEFLGLPIDLKITNNLNEKKRIKKIFKDILKSDPIYYELFEHYRFSQLIDLLAKQIEFLREFPQANPIEKTTLLNLAIEKKEKSLNRLDQFFKEMGVTDADWQSRLTLKGYEAWSNYLTELKNLNFTLKNGTIHEALQIYEELPDKPRIGSKNSGFPEPAAMLLKEFLDDFTLDDSDDASYIEEHQKINEMFFNLSKAVLTILMDEKRSTGEITINDLELFSLELIQNHPESIGRFQNDWDYFMIDEYQDTSPLQVKILDQLIHNKPYFIVGDPQQSIYLFRGARSEVFFEKEQKATAYPEQLTLKQLQTNYRSEPGLMHFMNNYFSKLGTQFQSMSIRPQDTVHKSKVEFVESKDQSSAALHKILELAKEGVDLKDICVLSRKNNHLIELAREAQKLNVPVQLQVATGFSSRREILDLGAFLRFLINPHDNDNLILLLRSPWFYLSDDQIYSLRAKSGTAWSALETKEELNEVYKKLKIFQDDYRLKGISSALLKLVNETGFLEVSSLYDSSGKREANFWKFFSQLKKAEQSTDFLLAHFLSSQFQDFTEDLGSTSGEADPVIQPNRVNLMSVHAAKGLQFPYVIVIGFSDKANTTNYEYLTTSSFEQSFSLSPFLEAVSKNVPSSWATLKRKEFNQKELQEHERFLYVALTRAEKELTLISETSKKFSSSWRHLGFWPEEGLHETDQYEILSMVHDLELEKNEALQFSKVNVRLKFKDEELEKENQFSVTSTLEDKIENSYSDQPRSEIQPRSEAQSTYEVFLKAQVGTDLHRLFESLKYNSFDDLKLRMNNDQLKIIQTMQEEKQIPFQKILQNGHAEMGFGLKLNSGILQGQIDLWAIVDNQIYLIDYKTGRSEYQDKAFEQLAIYTICLQKMNLVPLDQPIHLVAWYVAENKLIKKTYKNFQDFKGQVPDKILKLFPDLVQSKIK